jgi:hypothetical protein
MSAMSASSVGLAGLIAACHHRSLCALSDALHTDHEGLSIAARAAGRSRLLSNASVKKLVRLDQAFSVARHLTTARMDSFGAGH